MISEEFDKLEPREKLKYLRENNIEVYSISKLGTLDECYLEYKLTYIDKLQGEDNIYGFLGSKVHSILENKVNGKNINFTEQLKEDFKEAEFMGYNFPTDKMKEKWENDILSFAKDYQVPNYKKVETEKLFVFEMDNKFIQGIIDLLIYNEDGTVSIVDYKTSSKFSNSELPIKGRQLILYGLAMEQQGHKVKELMWNMLKYVQISYKLKNGKTKTTIAERGYIVEKLQNDISKELRAHGYSEFEIEAMVLNGLEKNSLEVFPKGIQDKYTIEDYIVKYDFSEENKVELRMFAEAKINEIETMKDKEDYWDAKEITKWNSFYCENLCSRKKYCQAWQDYKETQERIRKEDEEEKFQEEFDDFAKIF